MNSKAIIAMIGRKNVTLAAGVLIGLLLAAQYPELVEQVKSYSGTLGAGGVLAFAVSVWLSLNKEANTAYRIEQALYTPVPDDKPKVESNAP